MKSNLTRLALLVMVALAASCSRAPEEPVQVSYRVEGMTCAGCENAITSELSTREHVLAVVASHRDEQVQVLFEGTASATNALASQIASLGYAVKSGAIEPVTLPVQKTTTQ